VEEVDRQQVGRVVRGLHNGSATVQERPGGAAVARAEHVAVVATGPTLVGVQEEDAVESVPDRIGRCLHRPSAAAVRGMTDPTSVLGGPAVVRVQVEDVLDITAGAVVKGLRECRGTECGEKERESG